MTRAERLFVAGWGASPHFSPVGWVLACCLNPQGIFFRRKYAPLFRSIRKFPVNPKPCAIIPPPGEKCGLARENGFATLSLVAFEQNKGAVNLYDKLGYTVVDQAPVVRHPLIHYEGIALLMVRSVR